MKRTRFPNASGIYMIRSTTNGKYYIGSAVSLRDRKIVHLSLLKENNHFNRHLQNHINKYGLNDLKFSILEFCLKEKLIEREQYYIDILNPEFNICLIAGSNLGVIRPLEVGRKISESNKGKR